MADCCVPTSRLHGQDNEISTDGPSTPLCAAAKLTHSSILSPIAVSLAGSRCALALLGLTRNGSSVLRFPAVLCLHRLCHDYLVFELDVCPHGFFAVWNFSVSLSAEQAQTDKWLPLMGAQGSAGCYPDGSKHREQRPRPDDVNMPSQSLATRQGILPGLGRRGRQHRRIVQTLHHEHRRLRPVCPAQEQESAANSSSLFLSV